MGVFLLLKALVVTVTAVEFPIDRALAESELSLCADGGEIGVGVLVEQPPPGFEGPASHEDHGAVGNGQVHAEGVVGVVPVHDKTLQDGVAGATAQVERFGRRLGMRLPVRIGKRGEHLDPVGQPVPGAGKDVDALVRGAQKVEPRAVVVEPVRGREGVEVPRGWIVGIEHWLVGPAIVQHAVVQRDAGKIELRAQNEAALGREGGAECSRNVAGRCVRGGKRRALAVRRLDPPLVTIAGADDEVRPAVAAAELDSRSGR